MSQLKKSTRQPTLATACMILLCATQQLACSVGEEALDPDGIKVAQDLRALSVALDQPVESFERPAGIVQQDLAASPESREVLGIETWKIYRMPLEGSDVEMVDVEGFTLAAQKPLVALRMSPDATQQDTAFRFDGKEYKLADYPGTSRPPTVLAVQALWDFETRALTRGVPAQGQAAAKASPWCAAYTVAFHAAVYSAVGSCAAAAAEEFLNPVADGWCLYSLYSVATNTDNIIKYCGRNPPALPSVLILPGSYKKSCNLGVYRYHASGGKVQLESSCRRKAPLTNFITSRTTLSVKCLPVYGDIANCDGQLKCGKCP